MCYPMVQICEPIDCNTLNSQLKFFQYRMINLWLYKQYPYNIKIVLYFRTPIIFRQPPLSAVSNIFILPLNIQVWKSALLIIIVIIIILWFQFLHPSIKTSMQTFDIFTMVWGAVCQQGNSKLEAYFSLYYKLLPYM